MNRIIVTIGLLIAFVSMLFDGFVSYKFLKESKDLADERTRIIHDILCLNNYFTTLLDIETGQRGYLITGNKEYLKPYKDGVIHLKSDFIKDFIKHPHIIA